MNDKAIDQRNSKRLAAFVEKQIPTKEVEAKERQLRPQLLDAARNERTSRYELGRMLDEYQKLFPQSGLTGVADAIGISRSTANRIRDGYRKAHKLPVKVREAVVRLGIDPGAPESKGLVKRLTSAKVDLSQPKVLEMVLTKSLAEENKEQLKAKVEKAKKTKATKAANKQTKKPSSTAHLAGGSGWKPASLDSCIDEAIEHGWTKTQLVHAVGIAWDRRSKAPATKAA